MMKALEESGDFFTLILSIPLEVFLCLIFIGISEFVLVFGIAYLLKKRARVGKLNLWMISFFYIIFVIILLFSVDYLLSDALMYYFLEFFAGLLFAFFWLGPLFQMISLDAVKTYIMIVDLEARDFDFKVCYTYDAGDNDYIIEIDKEGHESIWSFVKRLFTRRWELRCDGIILEFTVKKKYRGIFARSVTKFDGKEENESGKMKKVKYYDIETVPTHKFTELKFLTGLQQFENMLKEMERLFDENTELKEQTEIMARKKAKKWIESINIAYQGDLETQWNKIIRTRKVDFSEFEESKEEEG